MCTGCDQEEHLLRGWQLNADYYLTKPFDLDEVDTLLKELAQKRLEAMDAAAVESLEIPMPDVPVPSLSE